MVVGETITSGPITKYEKRTIGDKEYHLFFVPLAAHLCESITLYQLDGVENNQLSGEGYRIEVALGDQTTVNTNARNEMENIDSTCVGYGVAYAYNKYEVNPDIFPNGVQDVKFKVKGILCYDPRKVFPVPTGLNRVTELVQSNVTGVPRTHGAEPAIYAKCFTYELCSPYPRG